MKAIHNGFSGTLKYSLNVVNNAKIQNESNSQPHPDQPVVLLQCCQ